MSLQQDHAHQILSPMVLTANATLDSIQLDLESVNNAQLDWFGLEPNAQKIFVTQDIFLTQSLLSVNQESPSVTQMNTGMEFSADASRDISGSIMNAKVAPMEHFSMVLSAQLELVSDVMILLLCIMVIDAFVFQGISPYQMEVVLPALQTQSGMEFAASLKLDTIFP